MVAYSFQSRFAEPILAGTKTQTIRAPRKRHARDGETLQLYTGMRTRQCRLIATRTCIGVSPIWLMACEGGWIKLGQTVIGWHDLDAFAVADGFADWPDLCAFWRVTHPAMRVFEGVLIRWEASPNGAMADALEHAR